MPAPFHVHEKVLAGKTEVLQKDLYNSYFFDHIFHTDYFNPLNADLNSIFHLLALLGAHHIFHVSRIRVN
jgi:hypothetical protein